MQRSVGEHKLFIGGIPQNTKVKELKQFITQEYGPVSDVYIPKDKHHPHLIRGFAFVTFVNVEDSRDCLQSLREYAGKQVSVKVSVDPNKAKQHELEMTRRKVYVKGIPNDATEKDLRTHFARYGEIDKLLVHYHKNSNQIKNFCFVIFKQTQARQRCLEDQNQSISGYRIEVQESQAKLNQLPDQKEQLIDDFNVPQNPANQSSPKNSQKQHQNFNQSPEKIPQKSQHLNETLQTSPQKNNQKNNQMNNQINHQTNHQTNHQMNHQTNHQTNPLISTQKRQPQSPLKSPENDKNNQNHENFNQKQKQPTLRASNDEMFEQSLKSPQMMSKMKDQQVGITNKASIHHRATQRPITQMDSSICNMINVQKIQSNSNSNNNSSNIQGSSNQNNSKSNNDKSNTLSNGLSNQNSSNQNCNEQSDHKEKVGFRNACISQEQSGQSTFNKICSGDKYQYKNTIDMDKSNKNSMDSRRYLDTISNERILPSIVDHLLMDSPVGDMTFTPKSFRNRSKQVMEKRKFLNGRQVGENQIFIKDTLHMKNEHGQEQRYEHFQESVQTPSNVYLRNELTQIQEEESDYLGQNLDQHQNQNQREKRPARRSRTYQDDDKEIPLFQGDEKSDHCGHEESNNQDGNRYDKDEQEAINQLREEKDQDRRNYTSDQAVLNDLRPPPIALAGLSNSEGRPRTISFRQDSQNEEVNEFDRQTNSVDPQNNPLTTSNPNGASNPQNSNQNNLSLFNNSGPHQSDQQTTVNSATMTIGRDQRPPMSTWQNLASPSQQQLQGPSLVMPTEPMSAFIPRPNYQAQQRLGYPQANQAHQPIQPYPYPYQQPYAPLTPLTPPMNIFTPTNSPHIPSPHIPSQGQDFNYANPQGNPDQSYNLLLNSNIHNQQQFLQNYQNQQQMANYHRFAVQQQQRLQQQQQQSLPINPHDLSQSHSQGLAQGISNAHARGQQRPDEAGRQFYHSDFPQGTQQNQQQQQQQQQQGPSQQHSQQQFYNQMQQLYGPSQSRSQSQSQAQNQSLPQPQAYFYVPPGLENHPQIQTRNGQQVQGPNQDQQNQNQNLSQQHQTHGQGQYQEEGQREGQENQGTVRSRMTESQLQRLQDFLPQPEGSEQAQLNSNPQDIQTFFDEIQNQPTGLRIEVLQEIVTDVKLQRDEQVNQYRIRENHKFELDH